MRIGLDVMGGDFAPLEIVLGSIQAVREFKIPVVLVGDKEQILTILKNNHEENNPLIEIHHASEVIEMGEHPGLAYRKKKDASVSVGARLVRAKECGALVAPGSTGAAVTAGLLGIGRIKGIERPAILTPIPNEKGRYTYLIDSGASAQPKVETYVQNAILGYIYASKVAGIKNPRIGLLNIGEEDTKGSPLVTEANKVLQNQSIIPFSGNAEGRDIMTGEFDVVVTDGFTGNVVLKFGEGAGKPALADTGWPRNDQVSPSFDPAATENILNDFPVERIYRDVRVCQIYEGMSDVQKIIIQRALA